MIRTKANNVRQMLLDAGVPSFLTTMVIPFMWFIPGAVDPDSSAIIEINKGMQRSLRRLGYKEVRVNGILDRETALALDEISPPRGSWMQKTFVQIYGDIERARKNPDRAVHKMLGLAGFDGYFEYRGEPPGPLPSWRAGTPSGPLGMGAIVDAGTSLNFGAGIRDKSSMVPIPRRAGVTYDAFKGLQRAINRLLSVKSEFTGKRPGGRIGEDGVLGKGTLRAFKKVQDAHFRQSFPGDTSTVGLASNAVTLRSILEDKANSLGVSRQANRGSAATSAATERTAAPLTEQQAVALDREQTAVGAAAREYLPYLAIAGVVAWYAAKRRRRKKGK